jgi:hypothetical protein
VNRFDDQPAVNNDNNVLIVFRAILLRAPVDGSGLLVGPEHRFPGRKSSSACAGLTAVEYVVCAKTEQSKRQRSKAKIRGTTRRLQIMKNELICVGNAQSLYKITLDPTINNTLHLFGVPKSVSRNVAPIISQYLLHYPT